MSAPRWRVRPALAAGVAALALALGACGDDDSPTDTSVADDSPTKTAATPTVAVNTATGTFDAQKVYADASPSVVTITSIFGDPGDPIGEALAGQGSGFVIDEEAGEIVTNAHVVTDAGESGAAASADINEASELFVEFGDRNQVPAEIVGFDPNADIALITVDPEGLDLQAIEFADSETAAVGAPVAAIGSPFGQDQSLSTGIVSATDRSIESLTQFAIEGGIQTDASINPGNSGGPLIGADGTVIGVNQQINTTSGGNEGVGFAIPSNLALQSVERLRENGEVAYPYIGVATQTLYPQLAAELDLDTEIGSLVTKVTQDSPAADAGLEAGDDRFRFQVGPVVAGGDVILEADGEALEFDGDLASAILDKAPGDKVSLTILRDGDEMEIEVTLGDRDEAPLPNGP